ncbi:hypothetical protein LTR84_009332 [Exophiala bonariae]|uniref:Zn(2)-C6 fungal-type domain-containing protein n=1 Tax=Exophiala bonariae TaxID=1690606 RepID=A0AAV9MV04_9EURO|nr:hypothetical protein LTR84_009332 [Exophiala bonariae]
MNISANVVNKPLLAPRPAPSDTQRTEVVVPRQAPRRNVTSACTACKAKRKKCDGNQPCSSCARLEVHCLYDIRHDGRRDLKKKLVAFERDSQSLHKVLDLIRNANEKDAASFFISMRKASSIEELETIIQEQPEIELDTSIISGGFKGNRNKPVIPTSIIGSTTPSTNSIPSVPPKSDYSTADNYASSGLSVTASPFLDPSLKTEQSLASSNVLATTDHSKHAQKASLVHRRRSQSSEASDVVDSRSTSQQGSPNVSSYGYQYVDRHLFPFHALSGGYSKHLIHESQSWHPALKYNSDFFTCPPPSYSLGGRWAPLGTLRIGDWPLTLEEQQLELFRKPEWSIYPLVFDDGSTLCRKTTSFLTAARILIEQGTSVDTIIGDEQPQVDCFFAPRRLTSLGGISVSHWACSLFSSFEDLERPFVLIWILLVYRLMRWMICPSAETYASLLPYQRPTLVQRTIPHSVVVDLLHLPDLRDAVCRRPRDFLSSAHGISLNWPKPLNQAVEVHPTNGSLYLTEEFKLHGSDLNNWTYSTDFLLVFPELQGKVRVRDP